LGSACLILLIQASGCGSSDSRVLQAAPQTEFRPSSTPTAADLVRLEGTVSDDQFIVSAVIHGPTTSDDLYSFAFDLVLSDPTVAGLVSGSATLGSALELSGAQTAQVLAEQSGERITIGLTKVGGGAGNGIAVDEAVIVTLRLQVLASGSTTLSIEGSSPHAPAALDSTGVLIDSVGFDSAPALLSVP
jgi:hypothetical protein